MVETSTGNVNWYRTVSNSETSSAPTVMEKLKSSLKDLAEHWTWKNQKQKLAGIGNPCIAILIKCKMVNMNLI